MTIQLQPFEPNNTEHFAVVATLWTEACGPALAISSRFVAYNARPTIGAIQSGRLALLNDKPVGFILVSRLRNDPSVAPVDLGWINAIAVLPEYQRQGVGTSLLEWGEQWLLEQRCQSAVLGGNLRPFTPGLPSELETTPFFIGRGYTLNDSGNQAWDVAANIATYTPPATVRPIEGAVRPAQPGHEGAFMEFLAREFPGRWRYGFQQSLHDGVRISDYMLLWTERGVDGFCQVTFEDSLRTIERFYPYQLPRPWGQLGPIGVSADCRGRGYGAALLDTSLRRLHNNGVNGCVIDWTTHLELYAKFGFETYREYLFLRKNRLGESA